MPAILQPSTGSTSAADISADDAARGPTLRERGYAALVRRAGGEWHSFAARATRPDRWRPHHDRRPGQAVPPAEADERAAQDGQSLAGLLWQELLERELARALRDTARRQTVRTGKPPASDRGHEFYVRRRHLATAWATWRRSPRCPSRGRC